MRITRDGSKLKALESAAPITISRMEEKRRTSEGRCVNLESFYYKGELIPRERVRSGTGESCVNNIIHVYKVYEKLCYIRMYI